MPRATGIFDVSLKTLPMDNDPGTQLLGRMSIDKQFHGDLEGTSKGRKGSFILQHTGAMNRGEPSFVITVVPDSGTDQLEGLKGTMKIDINAGKHSYELDYILANFP